MNHEAWMADGACVGIAEPNLFFPSPHDFDTRLAKRICFTCPVRKECLDYARRNKLEFGVWGGYTENERKRYRRRSA